MRTGGAYDIPHSASESAPPLSTLHTFHAMSKPTWDRDSRDSFSLWTPDGDFLCSIERCYEQRLSANGFALEANDTARPMRWTIARPGQSTRPLGSPGMSVREAKALALSLLS
jgi:hypothetical protein